MKAIDIKVGMTLQLKRERAENYESRHGSNELFVVVTRIKERPGYKVPWIIHDLPKGELTVWGASYEAYKPSDFDKCVSHHTFSCTEVNDNRARYGCICA